MLGLPLASLFHPEQHWPDEAKKHFCTIVAPIKRVSMLFAYGKLASAGQSFLAMHLEQLRRTLGPLEAILNQQTHLPAETKKAASRVYRTVDAIRAILCYPPPEFLEKTLNYDRD